MTTTVEKTSVAADMAFLIVDDEPDICWSMERILTKAGFRALVAGSGDEALEFAKQAPFALAFVDAKLPDIEGIELVKQLQQIQPGLSVMLISGYFYEDDPQVQQWMKDGLIRGFISKPFSLDQVRKAARDLKS